MKSGDKNEFCQGRYRRGYCHDLTYPKPVVAALNGHTIAGGCMLALACDYRIMNTGRAKISLNEITFGASVLAGGTEICDFNTPETTTTGFLDGMGLAMASGRCWKALLDTIPGFKPVSDNCIVHVGSRDLDPEERNMLLEANIPLIVPDPTNEAALLTGLNDAMVALKAHADRIYLHIDMDVLDTGQGQPNHLAVPGGLHPRVVEAAIGTFKSHLTIAACTIASYDLAFDQGDSVLHAGIGYRSTALMGRQF